MKKGVIVIAALLSFFSCGKSDRENAMDLLNEARSLAANGQFEQANERIDSLRVTYPRELDVRRIALVVSDSINLVAAKKELAELDSILSFSQFEIEDMKSLFVFEKDEKYQSVGNYVDRSYAGDKARQTFFIQVNEEGSMQLVTIDKDRKYHFDEIAVTMGGGDAVLPESATSKDFDALNRSYALARAIQQNRANIELRKKAEVKVQFFERKMKHD